MSISCSNPLDELGEPAYAALGLATWPAASHAMEVLESAPLSLDTTYIGPFENRLTPTIVRVRGRYWILREACKEGLELTSRCEQEAVAALAAAGLSFDPDLVRFVHRTPSDWEPQSTMRHVGRGRTFLGSVPSESCSVALPFEPPPGLVPGAKSWATRVAVHINHMEAS